MIPIAERTLEKCRIQFQAPDPGGFQSYYRYLARVLMLLFAVVPHVSAEAITRKVPV